MNPVVAKMPVPTMLEITSAVALKKPSCRSRPGFADLDLDVHLLSFDCGTRGASREVMAQGRATVPIVLPVIPAKPDWQGLHDAAAGCRACDLGSAARRPCSAKAARRRRSCSWASSRATTKIWRAIRLSVLPGRLLDRALEEAGIDRGLAYVTNVVKHFKWEPRGKRRIHAKPNAARSPPACRGCRRSWSWSDRACWSAWAPRRRRRCWDGSSGSRRSAASSSNRRWRRYVTATVHPSSILRAPDEETRHEEMARFIGI